MRSEESSESGGRKSRMAAIRIVVGILASGLLAIGCGSGDAFELGEDPSMGAQGVAEFSWEKNGLFACLFGCNAKSPVAAGATATLRVRNASSLPPFRVRSADETLARVTGTSVVVVDALRAGEVRILIEGDPGGAFIDEFVVKIAEVHRVSAGDRLLLAVEGSTEIEPSMFDARGRRLVGIGVLGYAPSPSLDQGQLVLSENCDLPLSAQYEECVRLSAADVGEGFLEIEAASGVTERIPLDLVVDAEVVTRIKLQSEPDDDRVLVRASAFAGDARVLGARCDWSLATSAGNLFIDSVDDEDSEAIVRGVGSGVLRCEIGAASGRVELRRN